VTAQLAASPAGAPAGDQRRIAPPDDTGPGASMFWSACAVEGGFRLVVPLLTRRPISCR